MKQKEYDGDLQKAEAKREMDKQVVQLGRHHDACERFLGNHIIGVGEPDITAATRESKWKGRVVYDWNVVEVAKMGVSHYQKMVSDQDWMNTTKEELRQYKAGRQASSVMYAENRKRWLKFIASGKERAYAPFQY